jgi:hypothetical protein
MSAAKVMIDWSERAYPIATRSSESKLDPQTRQQHYTRQISHAAEQSSCPHCGSIIYSRRNKLCGVCGESLPEQCLFTATEAEKVEQLLRAERRRHRRWNERVFNQAVAVSCLFE